MTISREANGRISRKQKPRERERETETGPDTIRATVRERKFMRLY